MRVTAFIACLIVGIDCAQTATGMKPQGIFSAEALWLWWVAAFAWVVSGVSILLRGAE